MKSKKLVLWIILVIDILIILEAGLFIWQKLSIPESKHVPAKVTQKKPAPVIPPAKPPAKTLQPPKPKVTASPPPQKPKVVEKPKVTEPKKEEVKSTQPQIKKLETTVAKKEEPSVPKVLKKTLQETPQPKATGELLFGFEGSLQGWEIPDWALEKQDHVGKSLTLSQEYARDGEYSLKLVADFPGKGAWTAAIIEVMEYFDWSDYNAISVDIYIPEGATNKLKGKIILTVGESWDWVEMSRNVILKPGQWTTIQASVKKGSKDWRQFSPDDESKADVRKLDIRIDSDKYPVYNGPIYIDNIRLIK